MEKELVDLSLDEEEDEASVVHFAAMKNTMANLWHHLGEIQIFDLVPLVYIDFWVQVHDLSSRFFSNYVAQQLGDFVGTTNKSRYHAECMANGGQCRENFGKDAGKQLRERKVNTKEKGYNIRERGKKDMEEDSEELLLENGEGKKRPKSNNQIQCRLLYAIRDKLGLKSPLGVRRLQHTLKLYSLQIVFFMETKLDNVPIIGTRGGLSLGWKSKLLVSLRSFSNNHIDVDIKDNEASPN
ncbi:hypothetical protein Goari_023752, partial [Gossypium aridum]|nr:hypothetical protein [Gossypium aridum]